MFYAVASGSKIGIFNTWNECRSYVVGVKGSIYKKFETKEACQEFINNYNLKIFSNKKQKSSARIKQTKLYSYVSNDNSIETSSLCGLGLFKNNIEIQLSRIVENRISLFLDNKYDMYDIIINNISNIIKFINPDILNYFDNIYNISNINNTYSTSNISNINNTNDINNINNILKIHEIINDSNDNIYKSHIIFTDGSLKRINSSTNIVKLGFYYDGLDKYYFLNMDKNTTNNQCELLAIYFSLLIYYEKLKNANIVKNITIVSDSDYSINSLTKWYKTWKKNNWYNSKKEKVKNKEIIQIILELINKYRDNDITVYFIHQNSHKSLKDMHNFYKDYVLSINNVDIGINEKVKLKNKSVFALGNYYVDYLVQN